LRMGSDRLRTDLGAMVEEQVDSIRGMVSDGLGEFERCLAGIEAQVGERAETIQCRLEEVLNASRLAGQASIRFLLDRLGLVATLEYLSGLSGYRGGKRGTLAVEGLGLVDPAVEGVKLVRLVDDAVHVLSCADGRDHISIRLRRRGGRCLVHVENLRAFGAGPGPFEHVRRRLEARVAELNGAMDIGKSTEAGKALLIDVRLDG
jgi:hypothetical protein